MPRVERLRRLGDGDVHPAEPCQEPRVLADAGGELAVASSPGSPSRTRSPPRSSGRRSSPRRRGSGAARGRTARAPSPRAPARARRWLARALFETSAWARAAVTGSCRPSSDCGIVASDSARLATIAVISAYSAMLEHRPERPVNARTEPGVSTRCAEHGRDRAGDDRDVEPDRPRLDVGEVEPHQVVELEPGAARDLPEPGHPGQDERPGAVPVLEHRVVPERQRPRADEAHLARGARSRAAAARRARAAAAPGRPGSRAGRRGS